MRFIFKIGLQGGSSTNKIELARNQCPHKSEDSGLNFIVPLPSHIGLPRAIPINIFTFEQIMGIRATFDPLGISPNFSAMNKGNNWACWSSFDNATNIVFLFLQ